MGFSDLGATRRGRDEQKAAFFNMVIFMFVLIFILLLMDDATWDVIDKHLTMLIILGLITMIVMMLLHKYYTNKTSFSLWTLFGAVGMFMMGDFVPLVGAMAPLFGLAGATGLMASVWGASSDFWSDMSRS